MSTRAERIAELEAQLADLQARPAEPPFDGTGFPPVVRFKYQLVDDEGTIFAHNGVATRFGDVWAVLVDDPEDVGRALAWDDFLDWLAPNQVGGVKLASWGPLP